MSEHQESNLIHQFRTVVTGYRLHGELHHNTKEQQLFSLKIQSSANKQEKYQILFDNQTLNLFKLNQSFSSSKALYDHLSKMTKIKIRFNQQQKILTILHERQKILYEFPIELNSTKQNLVQFDKKQIETTFSEDKQQYFEENIPEKQEQKVQEKQIIQEKQIDQFLKTDKEQITKIETDGQNKIQQLQSFQEQKQVLDANNIETKINQLNNFFDSMTKQKQQEQKPLREMKQISYNFVRNQSQQQTLYEYSFNNKVQVLLDLIQCGELDKREQIILKRNKISVIPPFNQIVLLNLKHLSVEQNKLLRIQNLQKMPNLQKLNMQANKISVMYNLSYLSNLRILKLGNNDISVIGGLQKLSNLQTLWLDFNCIERIQGLSNLSKLRVLNLSFNNIKRIQNMDNLQNLQQLLLNQNQIVRIQNLDKLSRLIKLSINMNSIQKIRGLKKLLLLQVVYLSENKITQFGKIEYEQFNWLKMLKQIKLWQLVDNFIQWNQQAKSYVQKLKNYGVKVNI